MDLNKLKLIIWDLDDTFWEGTLTEGGIKKNVQNIELVKRLTDHGIINSICSKNDFEPVKNKLIELDIFNYFVFPSVDWSPKGPRINEMLKDMGLRAENTIFIDDNIVNLNEARHYNPSLTVAEPSFITEISDFFSSKTPGDLDHKRLKQYQVLEKKTLSKKTYSDNESFLYASNTQVEIKHDCVNQIDRIHELITRTNQLNYTKKRISKEALRDLLNDTSIDCGYVTVKDAFGDYGIVGFYALKDEKIIHFLFSCRTIGQGVEQYVYANLNYPKISVEGDVIQELTKAEAPKWINQTGLVENKIDKKFAGKIIFKGACDLMGLTSYLKADHLITELTYISPTRHNNLEHQGTLTNFLHIPNLKDQHFKILEDLPFNDDNLYKTAIFDKDVKLIFISSLQEFHFGQYRHKQTGIKIAFGEWNHPLTDEKEWSKYINREIWTSSNKFTLDFLKKFSKEWEFIGRKTYEQYIDELTEFCNKINPEAHVCIFLGSELPYPGKVTGAWKDRDKVHIEANQRIREFANSNPKLHVINYTNLISSSSDYTDSIDHFQRYVHYKAAQEANKIIEEVLGSEINQSSRLKILINQIRDLLTNIHIALLKKSGKKLK